MALSRDTTAIDVVANRVVLQKLNMQAAGNGAAPVSEPWIRICGER
jgi:hypothetical protein